jgi:hypothetical protein
MVVLDAVFSLFLEFGLNRILRIEVWNADSVLNLKLLN